MSASPNSTPSPAREREQALLRVPHSGEAAHRHFRAIHDGVLARSATITDPNFTVLSVADLRDLHERYDHAFFGGLLSHWLAEDRSPITFRLSSRMTRVAGTTRMFRHRPTRPGVAPRPASYEIAVSCLLLFNSFSTLGREVTVGGLRCADRLEALQRVFEHELLHLTEMLIWGRSSCSEPNFHHLSRRIFNHEGVRHDLITPREIAATAYQIRVGDAVRFEFEGKTHQGIVNRITRRATVLVPDPAGRRFNDGRTYATFYVPIPALTRLDPRPDSRGSHGGAQPPS